MTQDRIYTAALLVIGNEILSGRTQDANLAYLASGLNDLGIRMMEARVIRDDEQTIIADVNQLRGRYDYLFTTGGIGPTHDDITSAAVAKAFGLEFGRNPEAEAILLAHYKPEEVTEARMKMAETPVGAVLLDNPVSRAPGFQVENVFVLPGVPVIMQAIFEGFKHQLAGGTPVQSRTFHAYIPEGEIGGGLAKLQGLHPDVEIGSYPFIRQGKMGASLVIRSADTAAIERSTEGLKQLIQSLGGEAFEDGAEK